MASVGVRPSPIAGQWYEGDPERLAQSVDKFINQAVLPELPGQIIAVIAPHAGHIYSGAVAGYAFAPLRGMEVDIVVIVSPMHYPYLEPLLTSAHEAYQTPLGKIEVYQDALEQLDARLQEDLGIGLARIAHDSEHSLEIELPFLQRTLSKPFLLIPLMLREQSANMAHVLGKALADILTDETALGTKTALLVASSDLSHFYPQHVANKLDDEMLSRIAAFDPDGVIQAEEQGRGFACGRGAIASVLWAARYLGANQVKVLQHATSGDVTGDYTRVVGYGAAVVLKTGDKD